MPARGGHGMKKQFQRGSTYKRLERIGRELQEIRENAEAAGRTPGTDNFVCQLANAYLYLGEAQIILNTEIVERRAIRAQLEDRA